MLNKKIYFRNKNITGCFKSYYSFKSFMLWGFPAKVIAASVRTVVIAVLLAVFIVLSAGISSCVKTVENIEAPGPQQDLTESGAPSGQGKSSGLQEVTVVLDWVPNTNHTGIYVAAQKGYYEENNLSVEIIQPSEGGSADLIAAGKGQFGISYQEQVTYARTAENPLPVIAIAAIIAHNTSGFASPVEKNITSPAQFEGKKYGGWGSPMEEAILKGLMAKYGSDFEKLEIINIGAADFFTSVTRDVDFTWIYYGWDGVAAEVKDFNINFMLLQELDSQLDFYTPVIITSEKIASENPEMIKSFLTATEKGYSFAQKNPEAAADILISEVPELDREIVVASQKYLAGQYTQNGIKWGQMHKDLWETFGTWMYGNNLMSKPLVSEKAFTNEFLP